MIGHIPVLDFRNRYIFYLVCWVQFHSHKFSIKIWQVLVSHLYLRLQAFLFNIIMSLLVLFHSMLYLLFSSVNQIVIKKHCEMNLQVVR